MGSILFISFMYACYSFVTLLLPFLKCHNIIDMVILRTPYPIFRYWWRWYLIWQLNINNSRLTPSSTWWTVRLWSVKCTSFLYCDKSSIIDVFFKRFVLILRDEISRVQLCGSSFDAFFNISSFLKTFHLFLLGLKCMDDHLP